MKSLFGRKKKDEIPDVEDPEVKESLHDIAENSETEVREELFRGMETEVKRTIKTHHRKFLFELNF